MKLESECNICGNEIHEKQGCVEIEIYPNTGVPYNWAHKKCSNRLDSRYGPGMKYDR